MRIETTCRIGSKLTHADLPVTLPDAMLLAIGARNRLEKFTTRKEYGWLLLFFVLSVGVCVYLFKSAPPLTCPNDEHRYNELLSWTVEQPARLFQIAPTKDIRKPQPGETDHELFVAGPKLFLYWTGNFFHQGLRILGIPLKGTFFYMNIILLFVQVFIIWALFIPRDPNALPRDRTAFAINRGLFMLFYVSLLPLQGQHLFFRTYNPLLGVFLLVLIWLWKQDKRWSQFAGGGLLGSMYLVSPAAPLVTIVYYVGSALAPGPRLLRLGRSLTTEILLLLTVELLYQAFGGSFFYLFYRHIYNNVAQNQIGQPFPYFPITTIRYLSLFGISLLVAILLATFAAFRIKQRENNPFPIYMLIGIGIWLTAFELSPTIPLGRTMYAFWIFSLIFIATVIPYRKKFSYIWQIGLALLFLINIAGYKRPLYAFCAFEQEGPLLLFLQDKKAFKGFVNNGAFTKKIP